MNRYDPNRPGKGHPPCPECGAAVVVVELQPYENTTRLLYGTLQPCGHAVEVPST